MLFGELTTYPAFIPEVSATVKVLIRLAVPALDYAVNELVSTILKLFSSMTVIV